MKILVDEMPKKANVNRVQDLVIWTIIFPTLKNEI